MKWIANKNKEKGNFKLEIGFTWNFILMDKTWWPNGTLRSGHRNIMLPLRYYKIGTMAYHFQLPTKPLI